MRNRKYYKDIEKTIRNLITFSKRESEWKERLERLFTDMLTPVADDMDIEEDELTSVIQETGCWHMVFGYVFEEFATALWDDEKHTFIDEYLKRRGWREASCGRRYLQALNESKIQFWEIVGLKPGSYADVRPYGSQDKPTRVTEKAATESLHQWDCVAGRVIRLDNTPLFTGALLPLPPVEAQDAQSIMDESTEAMYTTLYDLHKKGKLKGSLADYEQMIEDEANSCFPQILFSTWITHIYQTFNRPMPQIRNSDGDDILPSTVRFPITASSEILAEALDGVPELDRDSEKRVWAWFPRAADDFKDGESVSILGQLFLRDSSLELEVNSQQRAQRGSDWLTAQLGNIVGQPLIIHENLTELLEQVEPDDKGVDFAKTAEGRAITKAAMDEHYQQILDQPIEMLNDKTPRECAANPDLHNDVVLWLKYLENASGKKSALEYDCSWIWKELGLEQYKP